MDGVQNWWEYVGDNFVDDIFPAILEHARIVLLVITIGTLVSISVGLLTYDRPRLRTFALTTSSIFLTIPSLALFAIFIPIFGIGNPPAVVAMILYSFLPILRNTVTGLNGVDPAVIESAKGVGMNRRQQLFSIRFPLAWPIILTGIRVSTQLTAGIAAIAVLVGGDGLGWYIQRGLTRLGLPKSIEELWVGIIFTVLLAIAIDLVLGLVKHLSVSKGIR